MSMRIHKEEAKNNRIVNLNPRFGVEYLIADFRFSLQKSFICHIIYMLDFSQFGCMTRNETFDTSPSSNRGTFTLTEVQNDKFIDQTPQSLTHFDFRVTTESE
jgi:hypothetical protein